jgi:hypothetical protein
LYFCRARSFDGYDYSDWSIVNAVKMTSNKIPICYIHNVYYPTMVDSNGQIVNADRPNG